MFPLRHTTLIGTALILAACSTRPLQPEASDPLERVNRVTYAFNDGLDRAIARPIATVYRRYAPQPVQVGLSNFFANLGYPSVIVNDFLQGKLLQGTRDTGRFLLNSTLGLGGLLDPASDAGLGRNDEDLGQTFGRWGIGAGPYLVLPVLGPSSVRDAVGKAGDRLADPVYYIDDDGLRWTLDLSQQLERRARLLPASEALDRTFDPYAFVRRAYLRQREYAIADGAIAEDDWAEFDVEDPEAEVEP